MSPLLDRQVHLANEQEIRKTWQEAVDKADWTARPSTKEWPAPCESKEVEIVNISGDYDFFIKW